MTPLGPRGPVSSRFSVGRARTQARVVSHSPPWPLTFLRLFSGAPDALPSPRDLLGIFPAPWLSLSPLFVLPSLPSVFALFHPCPLRTPLPAPLSIGATPHLARGVIGIFSPVLLTCLPKPLLSRLSSEALFLPLSLISLLALSPTSLSLPGPCLCLREKRGALAQTLLCFPLDLQLRYQWVRVFSPGLK